MPVDTCTQWRNKSIWNSHLSSLIHTVYDDFEDIWAERERHGISDRELGVCSFNPCFHHRSDYRLHFLDSLKDKRRSAEENSLNKALHRYLVPTTGVRTVRADVRCRE